MSESGKREKDGGVTVVIGGISAGDAPALPVGSGGKLTRMMSSAKKLAQTLGNYGGNLAESGQMAARGYAMKQHAEGVAAFVDAYARLSEQVGPEKAEQLIGASPESVALRRRTGTRLLQMEEQRQQNFEAVASQAAQKLPEQVSDEPVHPDWTARFFESVKDVSDETMQSLWSSVLAGEVSLPGRTSLRTLDVIKNLSPEEARMFSELAQFSFSGTVVYYPYREDKVTAERVLPYKSRIRLQDCGLVQHETGMAGFINGYASIRIGRSIFYLTSLPPEREMGKTVFPALAFTTAGVEISQFIPAGFPASWHLRALVQFLTTKGADLKLFSSLPPEVPVRAPYFIGHDGKIKPPLASPVYLSTIRTEDELRELIHNFPCYQREVRQSEEMVVTLLK